MGGFEALMQALRQRLAEQTGRHAGGARWIGTAGTSPFGAHGDNPEGVRIGQDASRHRRAAKAWIRRDPRNLAGDVEIGTRTIKVALRRWRQWARDGAADELDLDGTIRATAENGYLDVRTRPERRDAVKVLLLLDVGGSMDDHVRVVEELFSATKSEFKHFKHSYFHNCVCDGVWRNNRRRPSQTVRTWDLVHSYGPDWQCIMVGDAAMSPFEIAVPGGANEDWNAESGETWLRRLAETWPDHLWIHPEPQRHWRDTRSTAMIEAIFEGGMVPRTLDGLRAGMALLGRERADAGRTRAGRCRLATRRAAVIGSCA